MVELAKLYDLYNKFYKGTQPVDEAQSPISDDPTNMLTSVTPRVNHLCSIIAPLSRKIQELRDECHRVDNLVREAARDNPDVEVRVIINRDSYQAAITRSEQEALRARFLKQRLDATHKQLAEIEQQFANLKQVE
jgi:hypothetical protein